MAKLQAFGYDNCSPTTVPVDCTTQLRHTSTIGDDKFEESFPYKNMLGSLQFGSYITRPDITYAISNTGTYQANPNHEHCNALRKIFKYLRGAPDYGITYGSPEPNMVLHAFCDADYGNDKDDRHSRSGWIIFLNHGPVAWGSHKQDCLATSTTHAEYIAMYDCSKEVTWFRKLLRSLGFPQDKPTVIYCDNQTAIRLAEHPSSSNKTKHIQIKYLYATEQLKLGEVSYQYVPTHRQLADIFTKGLPAERFKLMRSAMLQSAAEFASS